MNSTSPSTRRLIGHEHARRIPIATPATARVTSLHKIAMLGNHLPRQCGIATFTTDLSEAISTEFPKLECFVLAMNDADQQYRYPERVRFEISETELAAYHRAAAFLNVDRVDLVSVQHEFGIFGGKAGGHVQALLRDLRAPIVTTLHTILAEPDPVQRHAMDELTRISDRIVVMSTQGASILREVHQVPDAKIDVIPHGIPLLPDAKQSKADLGLEGKAVILTFGLLSPDKGIEHVIEALPAILKRYPDTLYIVLGATHPHVRARHGEKYRLMLENRARNLGVDSNIMFHNRFVDQDALKRFLSAADIYITPYLNPEQITSGTLAYAVGSGKAVISTPYAYARELLSNGRGVLVPWPREDPRGISGAVIALLGDDERSAALRVRAATYGRSMLWPDVARSYVTSFEQARAEHTDRLRITSLTRTPAQQTVRLPAVNIDHLERLSDHTGILQHAVFSIPRYEDGYCLDDNARTLLLTTLLEDAGTRDSKSLRSLADRTLAFVSHAFDAGNGRFRNFMSYSRHWVEGIGSEDSHGRALWALGSVAGRSGDPGRRDQAYSLFHAALGSVENFSSPRAWAFTLLGIDEYLLAFQGESRVQAFRKRLAERLLDLYRRASNPQWPWFEDRVTYCNARLPQALLVSGWRMEHAEMKAAGLRSLGWLAKVQRSASGDETFAPIGSNGFYRRNGTKASFDQQPVEACAMVAACLEAQRVTEDEGWALESRRAFNWFLGQNQLRQPLYDASTGGCRDGLHADRLNENQGAESTLSFLLALVGMRIAAQSATPNLADQPKSDATETAP